MMAFGVHSMGCLEEPPGCCGMSEWTVKAVNRLLVRQDSRENRGGSSTFVSYLIDLHQNMFMFMVDSEKEWQPESTSEPLICLRFLTSSVRFPSN